MNVMIVNVLYNERYVKIHTVRRRRCQTWQQAIRAGRLFRSVLPQKLLDIVDSNSCGRQGDPLARGDLAATF